MARAKTVEIEKQEQTVVTVPMEKPELVTGKKLKWLKDFMAKQAPMTELEVVKVRCLREQGVWEITHANGKVTTRKEAILADVTFSSEQGDYVRVGCGGFTENIGYAHGKLLPTARPTSDIPNEEGVRFNRETGQFFCQSAIHEIVHSEYLVMFEGCTGKFGGKRKHGKNRLH